MKKKEDWEIKFHDFVFKNKDRPFAWGKWDCCIFSNECIKAMTGKNLIPKELTWKDEETAMKSIKEYGGTLLKSIDKACKKNKIKSIDKNFISKGDLVVFKEETQLAGICDGFSILGPTDDGISVKKDVDVLKVWRIDV